LPWSKLVDAGTLCVHWGWESIALGLFFLIFLVDARYIVSKVCFKYKEHNRGILTQDVPFDNEIRK
jgi:hypothetical protein